ncbi:MAG: VUT family protein, partial [Pseudomonadales bacterium]|nr:VUT family protein [Pseudomonadales bacterium]
MKPDPTPDAKFALRRQRTFLFLSGIFLGTLTMLNLLGISRFLDASFEIFGVTVPIVLAVGVLPYPITFLCTDLIGELFGRKRASDLVLMGLILNLWVVFILWLGGALPGFEPIEPATGLPVLDEGGRLPVFFEVRRLTYGSVQASMIADLTAQYCDVRLFHFWKWLTGGRY